MNDPQPSHQFPRTSLRTTRLAKYLAGAGVAARRKAEELIQSGKVSVNGQVVTQLPAFIDPVSDMVAVNGTLVPKPIGHVLYAFYKPKGVLSTLAPEEQKLSLRPYVAMIPGRVFPVGRLDEDSEGLLLLTNDGQLAQALTHPRYEHRKTYRAWLEGSTVRSVPQALQAIERASFMASGRRHRFDSVDVVRRDDGQLVVDVTVHEGLTHLVRRLIDRAGYTVVRLIRTQHGPYTLGNLKPGQIEPVSDDLDGVRA